MNCINRLKLDIIKIKIYIYINHIFYYFNKLI